MLLVLICRQCVSDCFVEAVTVGEEMVEGKVLPEKLLYLTTSHGYYMYVVPEYYWLVSHHPASGSFEVCKGDRPSPPRPRETRKSALPSRRRHVELSGTCSAVSTPVLR